MGPTALLPLRRKGCWGFFRPKNPKALARCEPANLGTKGQHATSRPPKPLWPCIYPSDKILSKMPKPLIWGCLLTADTDRFILFNLVDLMTLNISDCMALSEVWLANSELGRMWKELVMVWFEASGICLDRVQSWKPSIRVVSIWAGI